MKQSDSINSILKKHPLILGKGKKHKQKLESNIDTNQLKQLFNIEAKKYYASKNKTFNIDNENKNYLNLICKYFAQDKTFETIHNGDLKKGLFIYGSSGTGKTSSLTIINQISKKYTLKNLWFPIIETSEVVMKFNTEKNKDYVIKYYSNGNYMLDDLGSEPFASNIFIYGKEDIFIRILEARYVQFISKGTKTYITSNLTLQEIKKRYGSRIEDRFIEMFNILKLDGESRR